MSFTEDKIIEGYDAFKETVKGLENQKELHPLYFLFTGSDGPDGRSWCPDCVEFEALWEILRTSFTPEKGTLVRVKVGPREFWKDKNCPFRTDKSISINSVPTLVKWGTAKRLSDTSLLNPENIKMLMED